MKMKTTTHAIETVSDPTKKGTPDLTGRSTLVSNVLITWATQMVFFTSGFIMPRLIDRKLGQEVLGVWDFSWSLVTYFRFVDMGITTSVNRFVARHWGKQDIPGINRILTSATTVLTIGAVVILLITVGTVFSLPYVFADKLGEYLSVSQWSVFILGVMLAFQTSVGAYNGVLTGCHRWELQAIRNGAWQFITVVGMIVALMLGGGLITLSIIIALGQIFAHITLVVLAYRVCPGLKLERAHFSGHTLKELYIYGGKALIPTASELLLNQTTSILIVGKMGPAALAIFTRPRALLRQMDSLERKMAMILVPTTSSMDVMGRNEQIENLVTKSVKYSIYLVLPLIAILVSFGDEILRVWMGAGYANWVLAAILAVGFLGTCIQTPIFSTLSGLNLHGRGGFGQLVASAISVVCVYVALKVFNTGLAGAAVAVTVPLLIANVVYLPLLLCRRLGQDLGTFYRKVAWAPLTHLLPFAASLGVGRFLLKQNVIMAAAVVLAGGTCLAITYWRSVLPQRIKSALEKFPKKIANLVGFSFVSR